jgi:hypothetical protein
MFTNPNEVAGLADQKKFQAYAEVIQEAARASAGYK